MAPICTVARPERRNESARSSHCGWVVKECAGEVAGSGGGGAGWAEVGHDRLGPASVADNLADGRVEFGGVGGRLGDEANAVLLRAGPDLGADQAEAGMQELKAEQDRVVADDGVGSLPEELVN